VLRLALAAAIAGVVGFPAALLAWERTPYVTGQQEPATQPVKFDHRHHVRDGGIDCTFCHTDVYRSAFAGMPTSALCMGCHAQIWNASPELALIRASYFEDAPLAWERVSRLPDFVFFDHSVHVNKGVGCETCHGRVDQMSQVYALASFTMGFCLDCHRSPEASLRPNDRVTDMEWTSDRAPSESGRELARRNQVKPGTDCSTCHR
jgi:hypothetical protein